MAEDDKRPAETPGTDNINGGSPETEPKPAAKKEKRHLIRPKWLRIPLKTLFWIVVAILLIPVLLYIPPVQTLVKDVACKVVYNSTGMKIGIDKFRLKWPLDVSLQGVTVIEASGDTMVNAREVIADVKMLPLLHMEVDVNRLDLYDGSYRMVSPDSSMILKVKAGFLTVDDKSAMQLADSKILLNKARLKDGNLQLFMDVWKQKPSPTDSTSTPFFIQANELDLDNFTFAMSMLPTIDTLRLVAGKLTLRKGVIDLAKNAIKARSLRAYDGDVVYLTPTPEYIAAHPAPAPDTTAAPTPPMVIRGDSVSLVNFKALYAVKDAKPLEGFDPSYIQVSDVNVDLLDFYNASSDIALPVTAITAKERSGLQIVSGKGTFSMDAAGMNLKDFDIRTPYSQLAATAGIPFALMEMKPEAPVNVDARGSLGLPDIEAFMPTVKEYTSKLPRRSPLKFDLQADGRLDNVSIPNLALSMPDVFSLTAEGEAQNALDFKKMRANLDFDGSVTNPGIAEGLMGKTGVKLPKMHLKGTASANNQLYAANFKLLTSAGDLTADGRVSMTAESYNADVNLHNVNVAALMPDLGVGNVDARLQAHGAGFDPTRPHAQTDIKLDIAEVVYQKQPLRDIIADVSLHDGAFTIDAVSKNDAADFHIEGSGTVAPDLYTFNVAGTLDRLDLHALGLSPEANSGRGDIMISGTASPNKWLYDVTLSADSFEWTSGNQYFGFPGELTAKFESYADRVMARADATGTSLDFNSSVGLKPLIDAFMLTTDTLMKQIERKNVNVDDLQRVLPPFNLNVTALGTGAVGKYLNTMGLSMNNFYATLANDSLINGKMGAIEVANSSMRVDTLTLDLRQRGSLLDYKAHMGNRDNSTLAEFADVNVNGYLGENRALMSLTQRNQDGKMGYRLGFTAAMADSIATVHFTPRKATIAYLPWTFNVDNHVDYNFLTKRVDANLLAESNESSVHLLTQVGKRGNDELLVDIKNLHVQDFLQMSVFAPPITASLNANMKVGYTNNWYYGTGDVGVKDFTYDRMRVGNFDLNLGAAMNDDGTSGARAALKIDGSEAMELRARLRPDSITKEMNPEKLTLALTRFPLHIANAFLGADVARLSGYLNGNLDLKGKFTAPLLNGAIGCDSVGVFIPMIGSQLNFGRDSISMADNVLNFNDFQIFGANKNPLVISGEVDARQFSNISLDLGMNANDFQLINNDKRAKSEIYGKLLMDLNASAKGPMQHVNVNADLKILSGSDVTYSVPQTTAELTQQDAGDVVKFVNFNDTVTIAKVDSIAPSMAMRIVAGLTIEPGTLVTVDIPGTTATGNGKVQINPSGTLNYFQNYMGDMRLNGQLNIGDGFARYSVPIVGEKKFTFNPDSYVLFNGDIMNPVLSIQATDDVKANLLQDGNSRLVNFLVQLNVSNNLAQPKVLFDLSTEDDMTIQNDLLSMSAEQRSMAAINLLLTGQYNAQGVKTASSDLVSGALYGVLTSQINSWMANNVRGVDLSFGINQYDRTVDGQSGSATSYSYTMSKSLFNNRFKISVGGNYTTDASADENFSENLINDISFEYILKQTSNLTMYARLFRHTGFESILEGEITETGVGFVIKRRLSTLKDFFRWGRKPLLDAVKPEEKTDSIQTEEHEEK